MKYEHLKLKVLEGEYKYVLFEAQADLESILKIVPRGPMALFRSPDEISAIIPSATQCAAKKIEPDWFCMRIIGEMPFGTVQGLIAEISSILASKGMGICVVSTFLTDWFFVKSKNSALAVEELKRAGWGFIE